MIPYERIVAEDMEIGGGFVTRTMPAGGTATGSRVNITTLLPQVYNVRDYGAVGDGVTDDTAAFQTACTALGRTGGILYIPKSTSFYAVTNPIAFDGLTGLQILSNGAELRVPAGTADAPYSAWPTYALNSVIRLLNCQDVVISGLAINGNLTHRTAYAGAESFNSLIHLAACVCVKITDCTLTEGMTDGVFVGMNATNMPSEQVALRDCTLATCRRNNVSAVGVLGFVVERCDISAAGTVQGTSPKAAIDVEPTVASTSEDIHIVRNRIYDNAGTWSVLLTGTPGSVDARIDHNVIENNLGSAIYINEHNSGVYVTHNTVRGHATTINDRGVYILGTGVIAVAHNSFEDNSVGAQADAFANVCFMGNRFVRNTRVGIVISNFAGILARLRVLNNYFLDNTSAGADADGVGQCVNATTDANSIVEFSGNMIESSAAAVTLQAGPLLSVDCHDLAVGNVFKNVKNNTTTFTRFAHIYSNLSIDAPDPYKVFSTEQNFNAGSDLRIGDRKHTSTSLVPPASGAYVRGDISWNVNPQEFATGAVPSVSYTIVGWVCLVSGSPGTWLELRCMTGH